jgi:hypothetical protein
MDAATLEAVLAASRGEAVTKASKPKKPPAEKKDPSQLLMKPTDVVVVEQAKSGRAKCRKCSSPLEEGETRVGMYAWIMGRNAITWQKPQCFVENLIVGKEVSGRGVCKKTEEKIAKGAVKVGFRSHTATSWVLPGAVAGVMKPLAKCGLKMPAVDGIDGAAALSADELQALGKSLAKAGFKAATGKGKTASKKAATGKGKTAPTKAPAVKKTIAKPAPAKATAAAKKAAGKAGSKVGEKVGSGTVQWRFGAGVAKGVLMPAQETDTMCYARTEKGNTKALGKGKDYWWKC